MALSRLFKGSGSKPKKEPGNEQEKETPRQSGGTGLGALFQQGVTLQPDRVKMLKEGFESGLEFFENFNQSRLRLAFDSFDVEMKKALYEVIYLVHVNDPSFAQLQFTGIKLEHAGGVVREIEYDAVADLYLEGAPCGVEGIGGLSEVFKGDFTSHIRDVFGAEVSPTSTFGYCPIKSVHSLGSIGTVGHKSRASDLDLQVQYELEPFIFDTGTWSDQSFKAVLNEEIQFWMNRARIQSKLPPKAMDDPKTKAQLQKSAFAQISKAYPNLYRYLITKEKDYSAELVGQAGNKVRTQTLQELVNLIKRSWKVVKAAQMKKEEGLLQERLKRIQDYIVEKYPMAEIYLFSCSNDDYRKGHHGSTLVSKEASGSAYELILNYETLMPGIQITPMVPSHFIFPQVINDDPNLYDRMIDYIRFGLVDVYDSAKGRLVNLGATPDMKVDYVAKHSGAVYWEAFKASSGNLPKAILNLFRYEMLQEKRYLKTIIQLIKIPDYMNQFVSERPEDESEDLQKMVDDVTGIPPWALVDMEEKLPTLKQDPWWLRYKSLKIAFHEADGVTGIPENERNLISKIMDTAFALHVRISDVFTKPGDTRALDGNRELVLQEFLKRAFPPISARRKFLEHLFIGEVRAVKQFEKEMRVLFKSSLNRVNKKIAAHNIPGQGNQKEFEIWYHYYQENFEPAANVIPKTILKHLMVPRGRLVMGYELNDGWFFRSEQKESRIGKRFDTFGHLDHLPEKVMLREKSTFVSGLADCILNGYYGVFDQGTLKETSTAIDLDPKKTDLGNRVDNTMAFVRPDNIHRMLNQIITFFDAKPYHYMDCVDKKRTVEDLMILLNVFKFGRMSFLYRDNLHTWYCDEVDHKELHDQSHTFQSNPKAMFSARPLHVTIAKFLKIKGIKLDQVNLDIFVNPNSLSASQSEVQGRELAEGFKQLIMQVHGPKEPPEEPPKEPPEGKAGGEVSPKRKGTLAPPDKPA